MGKLTRPLRVILLLSIICTLAIVNGDRTENEERFFRIPALGRTAHLGHLYNEVLDEFRDVSVFSQKIPEEFITKAIKPKLTTISGPADTYQEKFKLLNIQEDVAANVLAGFTQVDGSGSFLSNKPFKNIAPNEVSGALIQKYRTVKESLEVYYSGLKDLYNVNILNHKEATHVVTGVEWGADTVVQFTSTSHASQFELQEQLKQFSQSQLEWTVTNATLSMSMSITSDVPVPFEFSQNLTQVYNLLREIPQEVKTINDGKGIPTKYVLTPLSMIKRFVIESSEPSNSANELNTWLLKEIISYFDEIGSLESQINVLYKTLHSQPNCLTDEASQKVDKLKASILELKSNLRTGFHKALKEDRVASGQNQALRRLSQVYSSNSAKIDLKEQLSDFGDDLKRTEFCADLKASHPNIEYVGRELNLDLKVVQSFNQSVYVLFTKAEFSNYANSEWQANLHTFLNELNQPGNKLYIVDCDFKQAKCNSVSQSVIHLYRNGRIVSRRVEGVYEEQVDDLQLQNSLLNSTLVSVLGAVTDKFTTLETEFTKTGCGGTVKLPAVGQFALLEYKSTGAYGNNERCVWTLDGTDGNVRRHLKLKVTLVADGLRTNDTVSLLSLNRWSLLDSYPLKRTIAQESDAEWHFLNFVSDSAITGTGFIVRVDVVSLTYSFTAHIIPAPPVFGAGSYSKVNGELMHQVLAVILPPKREVTFTIDRMEIETTENCSHNNFQVYIMSSRGNFKRGALLCGKFTSSPASFQTPFPIIALYAVSGDKKGNNSTFKVSWE